MFFFIFSYGASVIGANTFFVILPIFLSIVIDNAFFLAILIIFKIFACVTIFVFECEFFKFAVFIKISFLVGILRFFGVVIRSFEIVITTTIVGFEKFYIPFAFSITLPVKPCDTSQLIIFIIILNSITGTVLFPILFGSFFGNICHGFSP